MFGLFSRKVRSIRESMARSMREQYIAGLVERGLKLGTNVHFAADVFLDASHCFLISIGNNVTFAPNVRLIAHDASTKFHLGFTRIGLVTILDDCFIGDSVLVLPGVCIGPRAIVGSGSVVTKDVPENSVFAGNPARFICSLDDYLARRKSDAEEHGVFGVEYLAQNLNSDRQAEMLERVSNGPGYIV